MVQKSPHGFHISQNLISVTLYLKECMSSVHHHADGFLLISGQYLRVWEYLLLPQLSQEDTTGKRGGGHCPDCRLHPHPDDGGVEGYIVVVDIARTAGCTHTLMGE